MGTDSVNSKNKEVINGKKELTEQQIKIMYLFLAFFLPAVVMGIALAGLKITPFGSDTLLLADANAYYINTLSYAARMFKGLEGVIYSFEKGLGGNMMGHLCGILITPFGALLSLVNIRDYPTMFTFISVFNLSLGGLTMYILLADIYGHKRSNLIFSTSYALMGFNVVNVFQAVFFCAAPILPIMVMGLRRIIRGKSPALYIISIAYGVGTNAFFGFVLCAASLIFFIVGLWQSAIDDKKTVKHVILNYSIGSVCGGLIASALWLPGFLSLQGGRMNQLNLGDFSLAENMPFLEMGAKLFTGANSVQEEVNGLPNIFVGILPLLLVILFFYSVKPQKKDKVAAGVLLGVYLLSFYVNCLNLIMHAGATTNWFNYRYSYVFSFIALLIAAEYWQYLDEIKGGEVRKGLFVLLVAVIIIFSKKYEFIQGGTMLLDFVILGMILAVWIMHKKNPVKNNRKSFEIAVIELVCLNLLINYSLCIYKLEEYQGWHLPIEEYQDVVDYVDPLVQGAKCQGEDFYRIEINEQRAWDTGNDAMLYGYDGVGHGGSNERDFVRTVLCTLGIPWDDMRSCYSAGVTPATDSLLGLKYIIAKADLTGEKDYEKVSTSGDWGLYRIDHTLSPAFLADRKIADVHTNFVNIFDNLNRTWKGLSGIDKDVFIPEDDIIFEAHSSLSTESVSRDEAKKRVISSVLGGLSLGNEEGESEEVEDLGGNTGDVPVSALEKPSDDEAYISYSWMAKQDGPVYIFDRSLLSTSDGYPSSTVQYIGTYHKGDTITGYIPMSDGLITQKKVDSIAGYFRAAYLQLDVLNELVDKTNGRPVTLSKKSDAYLTGSFEADKDQVLMFTIPYDQGWTLTVDGKRVRLDSAVDLFMIAAVPEGSHTYEMRYMPPGLVEGLCLSAFSVLFSLIYIMFDKKIRMAKTENTEKTEENEDKKQQD